MLEPIVCDNKNDNRSKILQDREANRISRQRSVLTFSSKHLRWGGLCEQEVNPILSVPMHSFPLHTRDDTLRTQAKHRGTTWKSLNGWLALAFLDLFGSA